MRRCRPNWRIPPSIELDEPLLLQLATHPTLQRLCLATRTTRLDAIHVEAIVTLLLSTQTLQYSKSYTFSRQTLSPVLNALKENSTVTSLCLRLCTMNEEATEDFVDFLQHSCNKPDDRNNCRSVLRDLAIYTTRTAQLLASSGNAAGSVTTAGTLLVGSSLQSLHLSDQEETRRARPRDRRMAAFFTTLLQDKDQIRLASLTIDALNVAGAHALIEYLPNALSLRNLTVSQMNDNVDSALVVAALRRKGSLHNVDITKARAENNVGTSLEPFFTADEIRRVQAFCTRNQHIPTLLAVPRSPTEMPTGDSNNLHLYTRLFAATLPTDRTAPNNLVMGLLSGNQAIRF